MILFLKFLYRKEKVEVVGLNYVDCLMCWFEDNFMIMEGLKKKMKKVNKMMLYYIDGIFGIGI